MYIKSGFVLFRFFKKTIYVIQFLDYCMLSLIFYFREIMSQIFDQEQGPVFLHFLHNVCILQNARLVQLENVAQEEDNEDDEDEDDDSDNENAGNTNDNGDGGDNDNETNEQSDKPENDKKDESDSDSDLFGSDSD